MPQLTQKVRDQIANVGLPTGGTHPFNPKIVSNIRGEQLIEKRAVGKGPKRGKRGYVDDQNRIWVKDRAHSKLPDHWDVQVDEGEDYFRVDQHGNELP